MQNAPTQSLLGVVNSILDESIERKNAQIPYVGFSKKSM
jgi:kinesin family member C2/C3